MKRITCFGLFCLVLLIFTFNGCDSEPKFNLDHFKVYKVDTIGANQQVVLEDQFDRNSKEREEVLLTNIEFFANPVNKNGEGIKDPSSHLTWYKFSGDGPVRVISIRNQINKFHQQTWKIGNPVYLLVPTEKIEEGSSQPDSLDHFKCYEVLSDSALFIKVKLEDQFGNQVVTIGKPVYFCNPVLKNNEKIKNSDDHLACYLITSEEPDTQLVVEIKNQFGSEKLFIRSSFMICVPSKKDSFNVVRKPDLIPIGQPNIPGEGSFCNRDETGKKLIVIVKNQGVVSTSSGSIKVTVEFTPSGSISGNIPSDIPGGGTAQISFEIPSGCFDADCDFKIIVDPDNNVGESDETNNSANGRCIG